MLETSVRRLLCYTDAPNSAANRGRLKAARLPSRRRKGRSMYPIERVEALNVEVTRMVVRAPEIARKIKPGQFVMLRIDERRRAHPAHHERLRPGGRHRHHRLPGGRRHHHAPRAAEGRRRACMDFAGPLGNPTELEGAKRACVIGGGLGTAIAFPQAKWLHDHGCEVDVITGFRNKDLVILEDEIDAHSTRQIVMTDDGSNGNKGLVTQAAATAHRRGRGLRPRAGRGSCHHDEVRGRPPRSPMASRRS